MRNPGNYSSEASRALAELADRLPSDHYVSSLYGDTAIAMHLAPKFLLPTYGLVFDRDFERARFSDLLSLPYSPLVAEFSSPTAPSGLPDGDVSADKRIVIAMDHVSMARGVPHLAARERPEDPDGIAVYSVYLNGKTGKWELYPIAAIIDIKAPWIRSERGSSSRDEAVKALFEVPDAVSLLPETCLFPPMAYTPLVREQVEMMREEFGGIEMLKLRAMRDLSQETAAIIDLCLALNVPGADYPKRPAPAKLNKKRLSRGKPPLYEYTILDIDPMRPQAARNPSQGGTHASPRFHLRRGHLRRLRSGKVVHVRATSVGDATRGTVGKDYRIKRT